MLNNTYEELQRYLKEEEKKRWEQQAASSCTNMIQDYNLACQQPQQELSLSVLLSDIQDIVGDLRRQLIMVNADMRGGAEDHATEAPVCCLLDLVKKIRADAKTALDAFADLRRMMGV